MIKGQSKPSALVTLSQEGAKILRRLQKEMGEGTLYIHDSVPGEFSGRRFSSIADVTQEVFPSCRNVIYAAPCGVVVRAIAPLLKDKKADPAVIVLDVGARFAVSLLSGHEGGANELALRVANLLGCEPVITTTTEARKCIIVGVGCRRGVEAGRIIAAIDEALRRAKLERSQVRTLASADVKSSEPGLIQAAREMALPLRFIPAEEIRASGRLFARSEFTEKKVNLPAVAEPAALLAGRRTKLILPRIALQGVTVAIARENFTWSE